VKNNQTLLRVEIVTKFHCASYVASARKDELAPRIPIDLGFVDQHNRVGVLQRSSRLAEL